MSKNITSNNNDTNAEHQNFAYATSFIRVIFVILGIFIFINSRYAFIFFSAAIIPSIATLFADKAPHKCASATICTFNLIGALPYLKELYFAHSINDAAKEVIINPIAWTVIYASAFVGFVIYFTLPEIVAHFYVVKANMKILNLNEKKREICNQWDIPEDLDLKRDELLK
ncbi:MAG: hypothetical protein SFT91_04270 [Rickettsiaceae bacterium]|nr:hypothetical protein [Rickettsiaceae bacterium]